MPRRAFQYYVSAFADFVVSGAAIGDADSASPFLNLLVNREERDPGSVARSIRSCVRSSNSWLRSRTGTRLTQISTAAFRSVLRD